MYTLWSKLTAIEDVLIGKADDVVDYLRTNYLTPAQQIRAMCSERAGPFQRNSTSPSFPFRLLPESDSPFDALCDYVGFILYSYDGKSEGQFQRGDILLKDLANIPNSSSILQSPVRNPQVYSNLFKSLIASTFKRTSYERFVGLGIIYERYKWKFDAFSIGVESKRTVFSPDERRLLEMYILTWMKNTDDPRKMLDEQLDYVKRLLETQRLDMEKIWTPKEVDIAIKTFEYESEEEIEALFQTTPAFNTFANLRKRIHSKEEDRLSSIAEIFDHHRLARKTPSSEPSLYQTWKQLKMIENWLRERDFKSLLYFLNSTTSVSIESLLSIPVPLFLPQLGICPESDSFDSTLNYTGFLIYLYKDQEEFILNKHACQSGQLLIRQKEKLSQFVQIPNYRQTSFVPLLIHEYLYEWYFKEKPSEYFHGLAFTYEQNQWKFDVITYAGKHGVHSMYDTSEAHPMAASRDEQHSLDLILSSVYIQNKWKEDAGRMYTIEELQSMGRDMFRKQIEIVEKLNESNFDKNCQIALKNFIDPCRPKPVVAKRTNIITKESLPTSEPDNSTKQAASIVTLEQSQPTPPIRPTKNRPPPSKPTNSFWKFTNPIRKTTSLESISSASNTYSDEIEKNAQQKKSIPRKGKEPSSLYQLWRELKNAEQQMLFNADLTQFINYLTKTEYVNYSDFVQFTPPDDQAEEYHLMAEAKIDSQLKYLSKLFVLKRSKLYPQQSNQEKRHFEDLFKAFENYYTAQIERAKKHFRSK